MRAGDKFIATYCPDRFEVRAVDRLTGQAHSDPRGFRTLVEARRYAQRFVPARGSAAFHVTIRDKARNAVVYAFGDPP